MTTSTELKPLYHYTSQKGLLGILNDNKLWMTNILFLNDSSEFTYSLNLVKSEVGKREKLLPSLRGVGEVGTSINVQEESIIIKKNQTFQIIKEMCESYSDINEDRKFRSYVFSLSQREDDLSQWRSYCPKEGGFSIGFDYMKLLSIISKISTTCTIEQCIYDPEKIQELIGSFLDPINTSFESDKDLSPNMLLPKILANIIINSSFIKDESFKDEQEYRIVKHGINTDKINYCEGKSMIIPHVEFSPIGDDNKLPISKIIIGPTPHPELSKLSVHSLLKSKGYTGVEVEISNIPYRSW